MQINEKNNKSIKNSGLNDKNITKDFSEIFDVTENVQDLATIFIDARLKKGFTQEDVSKTLKVRVSVVKEIERGEELISLNSTYKLGFLRSYAKLVDLDPDVIIKNYKSSFQEKNVKLEYNFPGVAKEKKSLLPMIALFTFLFSLVVYSSWYYLNLNDLESKKDNIVQPNIDNRNLDYVKVEDRQNIKLDNTNKIDSEELVLTKKETPKIIKDKNSVNKVVENDNLNSKNFLKSEVSSNTSNSNETSAIANERIPKEEMVLKSSGNSWVEIEDLDGNSYLTRLMRSGETFVIPDKKGLTLSTGNAGVLSLTFGSVHISKLGSIGEVISSRPLNIEAFKKR